VSPFAPITLDRDAEVPLGTQLTWILRARVTGGDLLPGERLPGARELAAIVGVNVNTVRAVFARLEEEGLLTVAHGKGTFVAERASGPRGAAAGGADSAAAQLAAAVTSEARRRGIDPRAVAAALYVQPAELRDEEMREAGTSGAARKPEAIARRRLRAEIKRLERELAALPALPSTTDIAAVPPLSPSKAGRLLSIEELERQRETLAEQVAQARAAAEGARRMRQGSHATAEDAGPSSAKRPGAQDTAEARTSLTRGARLRWVARPLS
jgi:DNA-binding transcriptional regulator YhcF (GntR family)